MRDAELNLRSHALRASEVEISVNRTAYALSFSLSRSVCVEGLTRGLLTNSG